MCRKYEICRYLPIYANIHVKRISPKIFVKTIQNLWLQIPHFGESVDKIVIPSTHVSSVGNLHQLLGFAWNANDLTALSRSHELD